MVLHVVILFCAGAKTHLHRFRQLQPSGNRFDLLVRRVAEKLINIIQLDQIQATDRDFRQDVQDKSSEDFDKQKNFASALQDPLQSETGRTG